LIPQTILDLDVSAILQKLEERYRLKLPRKVVAIDYGSKGDLYLRFEHVSKPIGEPSDDGRVIFFHSEGDGELVAVEIMDVTQFT
jgi:hypothetical protein